MADLLGQVNLELAQAGLTPASGIQPLVFNPNNSVTVSVSRVLLEGGGSLVRKELSADASVTVEHWAASKDPTHWNYWCREPFAYTEPLGASGARAVHLATDVRATDVRATDAGDRSPDAGATAVGLRPPELLWGNVSAQSAVLLLEDVDGRSGAAMGASDHGRLAHRLGQAQGRTAVDWAADAARPAPNWWSQEWLRRYAASRPVGIEVMSADHLWSQPTVVDGFGEAAGELRSGFAVAMAELETWAAVLARLPQTLCHHDLWANNVICTPRDDVLIDWGCVGPGSLGEDLGTFVADGFLNGMQLDSVGSLDRLMVKEYSAGLRAGGWSGPEEVPRLGMCAAVAKYCWLPALMVLNVENSGPTGYGGQDAGEVVEVFRRRVPVLLWMLEMLAEARKLRAEGFA